MFLDYLPKDDNDKHRAIQAAHLKPAIEKALGVLGTSALQDLLDDLEKNGVVFEEGRSYTIHQIEQVMKDLFGVEATALITERILAELSKQG